MPPCYAVVARKYVSVYLCVYLSRYSSVYLLVYVSRSLNRYLSVYLLMYVLVYFHFLVSGPGNPWSAVGKAFVGDEKAALTPVEDLLRV